MRARVLVVEDREPARTRLASEMTRRGLAAVGAYTVEQALAALEADSPDVMIACHAAPNLDAHELCRQLVTAHSDVPAIVISAAATLDGAVEALRARASDYITDPDDVGKAVDAVERAIERRALRGQLQQLRSMPKADGLFAELVGASATMCRLRERLERICDSDATVLITGESGTGKEVVARALHSHGRRRHGPFAALSCAAIPPNLLESELFGHTKGAFTDASAQRSGLLVKANGGVLFLDEVASLPLAIQPKLLRALQERRVRPLGQSVEVSFDVRVVAATGVELSAEVAAGRFREDLFYRVNVLQIALPPLRERGYDVLLLAQHFIEKHASRAGARILGLTPGAAGALLAHPWPGNVRELENSIEAAVALARYDHITEDDLPEGIRPPLGGAAHERAPTTTLAPLDAVESEHIAHVLRSVGGNKTAAARAARARSEDAVPKAQTLRVGRARGAAELTLASFL